MRRFTSVVIAGATLPVLPSVVGAATFDGDGATDIFLIDSSGSIRWREAAGGGSFPERQNFGATPHIALGLGHFKTEMDLVYAGEGGGLQRAIYDPGTGLAAFQETLSGAGTQKGTSLKKGTQKGTSLRDAKGEGTQKGGRKRGHHSKTMSDVAMSPFPWPTNR